MQKYMTRLCQNHRLLCFEKKPVSKHATSFLTTNVHVYTDLQKCIEKDLKTGDGASIFERLEKADNSSLLQLPKRIWGSVFYLFNEGENFEKLDKIRAKTKDLNINCGEGAYTTLIKSYFARKQAMEAADALSELKNAGLLKHTRAYFPVITSLAENGYQDKAFELFDEMQKYTFKSHKGVTQSIPSSMAVALIKSCIGSKTAEYEKARDVLTWYSNTGRLLTLDVLNAVKEWFHNDSRYDWNVKKCVISDQGLCDNCGQYLQSGSLVSNEIAMLKSDILKTIERRFKYDKSARKRERFYSFVSFLNRCSPCDVILDGMSIGLSLGSCPGNRKFNFQKLLKVSNQLVQQGRNVLVVLNSSVSSSFLSKDVQHFTTDVGEDDLCIMFACGTWDMSPFVVTRDKFRDHRFLIAFQNHALYLKWIRSHTMNIREEGNNLVFCTQNYDPVVQAGNTSWHLPIVGRKWFCVRQIN